MSLTSLLGWQDSQQKYTNFAIRVIPLIKTSSYSSVVTLHNNTSFRTAIAFYSHSLGGDTDKSNTAWVRTL